MLWRKKKVSAMNGKRFIAAYSPLPFKESKDNARYPDYSFHTVDKMNWCVRIGDIEIPWGFGGDKIGFYANGTIILSRKNVSAVSFDGRGLPYTKEGDVFYLYEHECGKDLNETGFAVYMRDKLTGPILKIAEKSSYETFEEDISKLSESPGVSEMLNELRLVIKSVRVNAKGKQN